MGITGAFQDYGMRHYNSLIARFVSVDPITSSYPWYTPYQFAGNKPIQFIDLEGLEEAHNNLEENSMTKYYREYGEMGFMRKYYDDFVSWISETDSKTKVNDVASVVVPVNYINYVNKITNGQKPSFNDASLAIVDYISFATIVWSIESSAVRASTKKIVEKSGTKAPTVNILISENSSNKIVWELEFKGVKTQSSARLTNEGFLYMDFEVPANALKEGVKGTGSKLFSNAFNKFGGDQKIKGIYGIWNRNSTNYKAYMEGIIKYDGDISKTAFDTPTGRWAKSKGYTEYIKIESDDPSTILGKFVKPEK